MLLYQRIIPLGCAYPIEGTDQAFFFTSFLSYKDRCFPDGCLVVVRRVCFRLCIRCSCSHIG
jgi:hypothetical protein